MPRAAYWNPYIENATCLDQNAAELVAATFNMVSDFAILIIPIYTVYTLQMKKNKKLATLAIFAVGLLWVSLDLPFLLLYPRL